MTLGLRYFLMIGALLFSAGIFTVMTRRNLVGALLGIELLLNGANLNLVAFSKFTGLRLDGQTFALFVIVLAAAEAVVALAICLALYQTTHSVDIPSTNRLRG